MQTVNWNTSLRILMFWIVVSLNTGSTQFSQGQESDSSDAVPQLSEDELILRRRLRDPRETFRTFLTAMEAGDLEQASECLALEWLDRETSDVKAGTYADKLYFVLTRIWDQRTYRVSSDPDYESPYLLSSAIGNATDKEMLDDAKLISLTPNAKKMWRFSQSTLETIDDSLWPKWQERIGSAADAPEALSFPVWLSNLFPQSMQSTRFLLKDYQWLCLLVLTALGFLVGWLVRIMLDCLTAIWFRISGASVDDQPRTLLWRPVALLINALVWYYGAKLIDLPPQFLSVLLVALKFFSVVIAVWTAFRGIDLLSNFLQKKSAATATRYDDALVPIASTLLKFASILIGLILFVDVFELDWKTVIGGFGVGGIALALASKEVLSNFLGSITVLADRPFEIGDTVIIDGKVEGTVESVGMRSSRIRTYGSSEVVVPNSLLTTAIVDNLGRRNMRRLKTKLQIDYATPVESIEAFCSGVRQVINNSPYTRKENAWVYIHEFGESSIDILLYVFIETSNYETELRERHCLLRDILKLAEELSIDFAFPTRTLHLPGNSSDLELPTTREQASQFAREVADRISRQD